ncbi:uncharacterized protein MONOS_4647 [Monocercomonoides exilis]|uniref:uncharacterized protein n=1 Tax=Monocercomonoides exilis TaxID=2049356 RepID=UPI00355A10C4|nr:hypothetical protein MONOS_4647 [Monocercomonoides exilis]|eukprot:MONOS_4647.1-p1 / transcript=MONOS_4647.1 / gene=MONOS_4647 / organism=Monocercomonoides_exilis_PA203 / gene_product=unspecified product / transcript_product=unspecified product / location=Mono_scaffold00125:99085-101126(+) / protein_length=433 / sequence_SO=supercontig / SO=protein_coding / is_pseudo=false
MPRKYVAEDDDEEISFVSLSPTSAKCNGRECVWTNPTVSVAFVNKVLTKGLWKCDFLFVSADATFDTSVGVSNASIRKYGSLYNLGTNYDSIDYTQSGNTYHSKTIPGNFSFTSDDVVGCIVDMDYRFLFFTVNGTVQQNAFYGLPDSVRVGVTGKYSRTGARIQHFREIERELPSSFTSSSSSSSSSSSPSTSKSKVISSKSCKKRKAAVKHKIGQTRSARKMGDEEDEEEDEEEEGGNDYSAESPQEMEQSTDNCDDDDNDNEDDEDEEANEDNKCSNLSTGMSSPFASTVSFGSSSNPFGASKSFPSNTNPFSSSSSSASFAFSSSSSTVISSDGIKYSTSSAPAWGQFAKPPAFGELVGSSKPALSSSSSSSSTFSSQFIKSSPPAASSSSSPSSNPPFILPPVSAYNSVPSLLSSFQHLSYHAWQKQS